MQFAVEICAECATLLRVVPDENRRSNAANEKMTNENIDSEMKVLCDLLLLSDNIYRMCHKPCGTMTDADLADVGETIDIISTLWRESNLSVTAVKHTL